MKNLVFNSLVKSREKICQMFDTKETERLVANTKVFISVNGSKACLKE